VYTAGYREAATVDLAFRGLDLLAFDIDLDQRRRGHFVEQQTIGVDQEMVVPPRHARRDTGVGQVRPSE
jgi:hypothetical protein